MSEKKSGTPTSEEILAAENVYKQVMDLVEVTVPPHIYIAGLCVALGKIVGMSSILPEELDERVFKPITKAFEITRDHVLTVPEARARLEARKSGSGGYTIH